MLGGPAGAQQQGRSRMSCWLALAAAKPGLDRLNYRSRTHPCHARQGRRVVPRAAPAVPVQSPPAPGPRPEASPAERACMRAGASLDRAGTPPPPPSCRPPPVRRRRRCEVAGSTMMFGAGPSLRCAASCTASWQAGPAKGRSQEACRRGCRVCEHCAHAVPLHRVRHATGSGPQWRTHSFALFMQRSFCRNAQRRDARTADGLKTG